MSAWLLLQAAPPPNTPWWAVIGGPLVGLVISGFFTLLVARAQKKNEAPPGEDAAALKKDLASHGSAIGELRALVEELKDRAPGASPAQVKAALARITTLETWKKDRERSDEQRRKEEHEQDLKLERLLGNMEAKLDHLERDRDVRSSRV